MKSDRSEITSALEKRLKPDERIGIATEMDTRTMLLGGVGGTIFMLIWGLIPAAFVGMFASVILGPMLGAVVAGIVYLLIGFYPLIVSALAAKFGTVEYAITDDRFIKLEDYVLTTDEESLPLERARDAEFDEDIVDKILGNGDIKIEATRGDTLEFNNAPESDELYQTSQKVIQNTKTVDDRSTGSSSSSTGADVDIGGAFD